MTKQTRLRTSEINVNMNISVPIGNLVLAEAFFERFGLYDAVKELKTKGVDLGKLAEIMVAYKLGDNFSTLRCHGFAMQEPIRKHMGLPVFDVKTLYRAAETLGENREHIIGHFRRTFLRMHGKELTDMIFDWTSLVYFGNKPDIAARGYSRDGHPEECQMTVGIAQLAKPFSVPVGMTVMPGNTLDGRHMRHTYGQVKDDIIRGSTMVFDAGANQADVTDAIVSDGNHYITRRGPGKNDINVLSKFLMKEWECLDEEKGEYCAKRVYPSRTVCYYFSRELYELNMKKIERKMAKKLKEAKELQDDIEKGKKLKKRYKIDNVLIKATISLQTKLSEITDEEALNILRKAATTGLEGYFCLVSDKNLDPREMRSLYRDKDIAEKLFSSMKSDIGIRPIRAWTENGVYGVLLIGFLSQALISVTRFLSQPASSTATKFISDAMQKLTLTVEKGTDGRERRLLSNFDPLNIAVLRSFGAISEAGAM